MSDSLKIRRNLFSDSISFEEKAMEVAAYQFGQVAVYRKFAELLGKTPARPATLSGLPFLPVGFFQSEKLIAAEKAPALFFESSGTTGSTNSRHHIADLRLYEESIVRAFERTYGPAGDWVFFALLPSYLEREHASLVYMVDHLMKMSGEQHGAFFRFDHAALIDSMRSYNGTRKKMLIGVTFALWEMAEQLGPMDLTDVTILETGGMKGRRREIIREELHQILQDAFRVPSIHSEYGMTEMLSQAYSTGEGIFHCPPWMKVLIRDPYDPLRVQPSGKGALNVIDLANLYSCSFIATNDLGEVFEDGSFTVLGRMDNSQLRGCNLMF